MRNFYLFLNLEGDWIPISSPLEGAPLEFSTYEENLNEMENSQYELTCSIDAKRYYSTGVKHNPLLEFFHLGAKIVLIMDNSKRIDFIIKNFAPKTYKNNSVFEITAQDEFSYLLAKHNVGYNYSTIINGVIAPKSIFSIAREVLADNYLTDWEITTQSADASLEKEKMTLELTNSNPYAVLIEACNTVNAQMNVNYYTKRLDFYRKNLVRFSGYRYHPSTTAVEYNVDYSGEELTTILHVSGGTDAQDRIVSMVPSLPYALKKFFKQEEDILKDNGHWRSWSDIKSAFDGHANRNTFFKEFSPVFELPIKIAYSYTFKDEDNARTATLTDMSNYIIIGQAGNNYKAKINIYDSIDKKTYAFYFDLKLNKTPSFNFDDLQSIGDFYTYTVPNVSIADKELTASEFTLYFDKAKVDKKKLLLQEEQEKEIQTFFEIANKVPYLGQSIIDFSPFKSAMGKIKWNKLMQLINNTWRDYNIDLLLLSDEYFGAINDLTMHRNEIYILAEDYIASCKAYQKAEDKEETKKMDLDSLGAEITNKYNKLVNYIKNSSFLNVMQAIGYSVDLDLTDYINYFQKKKDEAYKQFEYYDQMSVPDSDNFIGESEQIYYTKMKETAASLCQYLYCREERPGLYPAIINAINAAIEEFNQNTTDSRYYGPLADGLARQYDILNNQIKNNVYSILYREFGQYIYEATYSNSTEIDSISLFNQAYAYFADINRAQSSHTLEVLDIGSLEQINTPRLAVGSLISIYNRDSINAAPYIYAIGKVEEGVSAFKQVAIDTYKDMTNQEGSTIVFNINGNSIAANTIDEQYHLLLELIYQDSVVVTGINRVLREPLKDSVTVQQSSRYKSILSKLIQSI